MDDIVSLFTRLFQERLAGGQNYCSTSKPSVLINEIKNETNLAYLIYDPTFVAEVGRRSGDIWNVHLNQYAIQSRSNPLQPIEAGLPTQ
jgi:hypothetical protein